MGEEGNKNCPALGASSLYSGFMRVIELNSICQVNAAHSSGRVGAAFHLCWVQPERLY